MNRIKFNETSEFLYLNNESTVFQFDLTKGTYDILDKATKKSILSQGRFEIHASIDNIPCILSSINSAEFKWHTQEITSELGAGMTLFIEPSFSEMHITFSITLFKNINAIFFQLRLSAIQRPLHLIAIHLLSSKKISPSLGMGTSLKIFKHDWQSWSPVEIIDLTFKNKRSNCKFDRRAKHSFVAKPKAGELWSDYLLAIRNCNQNQQLFLGFVTLATQMAQIRLKIKKRNSIESIQAICFGDSILLEADNTFESEQLMLSTKNDRFIVEDWAKITGTLMNARKFSNVPTGWCSWYQYWKNISEEKMLTNLKAAQKLKNRIPLEYIQLDDGYEPNNALGVWTEADPKKFPNGLKNLVNQIKSSGFKAGLWLAPFLISNTSKIYKEHPDWIIKEKSGKAIWGAWPFLGAASFLGAFFWDRVYALDLTNPEVQDFLRQTIETLVQEYGFDYLKIDFIYAAAIEGIRHDPTMTRIQAYRKGLEIIREAAGDSTFILGCGAPFGPAIGIVDAMRVSTDTAPSFKIPFLLKFVNNFLFTKLETIPSVKAATQQNMLRYFFHKNCWINDPDTLIVRSKSKLSHDEIRFEISAIGLLGGLLFLSDNLADYSPREIELVQLLFPPYGKTARPLYMLEENYPSLLILDINTEFQTWKIVGVFNWADESQNYTINLNHIFPSQSESYHIFEFWDQKYLGILQGQFQTGLLNHHSVKLYAIHPVIETPTLLSSTFHITQGAIEVTQFQYDQNLLHLNLSLQKRGQNQGSLFIYLPPSLVIRKIAIEDSHVKFKVRDSLLILSIEFQNQLSFTIQFL
ncbi:MAG: glycoside hydrolase family 36 protein [Candidatus Helarchaeota archaeon]